MGLFPNRLAVSQRTAEALAAEGFPARAMVEFGLEAEGNRGGCAAPRAVERAGATDLLRPPDADQKRGPDAGALLALRGKTRPFHFHVVGRGERAVAPGADDTRCRASDDGDVSRRSLRDAKSGLSSRRSEIFVLSSPREGFSIATLEAMAQGCVALVVSDPARPNGALDFVRHEREGLVVAPGAEALRNGLLRLIENEAERQTFRRAAWETARAIASIGRRSGCSSFTRALPSAGSRPAPPCSGGL